MRILSPRLTQEGKERKKERRITDRGSNGRTRWSRDKGKREKRSKKERGVLSFHLPLRRKERREKKAVGETEGGGER